MLQQRVLWPLTERLVFAMLGEMGEPGRRADKRSISGVRPDGLPRLAPCTAARGTLASTRAGVRGAAQACIFKNGNVKNLDSETPIALSP